MKKIYEMINETLNASETEKQEMRNMVGNSGVDFETAEEEYGFLCEYAAEHAEDSAD